MVRRPLHPATLQQNTVQSSRRSDTQTSSIKSHEWVIAKGDEGRLGSFLERCLEACSNKQIKRALEANGCRVNGRIERFPSRLLKSGDVVAFRWPGAISATSSILFSDRFFLILNKPSGWVCDSSILKRLTPDWGPLWLVHRLDRETTGSLILARTPEVRAQFEKLFVEGLIQKTYWAVVDGAPITEVGVQQQPLIRKEPLAGKQRWGAALPGEGLAAETRWHCLHRGANCALLECSPITGRTHQIRIHLALMGHPILGDHLYASRFRCTPVPERVMLHAVSLSFPHPVTGETIQVKAPIPPEMARLLKEFRLMPTPEESIFFKEDKLNSAESLFDKKE